MGAVRLLAIACAAATAAAAAQGRETEHCNPHVLNSVIVAATSFDARDRLAASIGSGEPDLSQRLWSPASSERFGSLTPYVTLYYRESEDIGEIAAAIRADPGLRDLVTSASPNGLSCFLAPPRVLYDVHEFHNEITNHYFLAANAEERRLIEYGAAGPAWKATGTVFKVDDLMYGDCNPRSRVYRFYTFGANSHVFTPDPQECGGLRKPGTGWIYEGVAFAATRPTAGQCPMSSPTPVYRYYNNRWMHNDSNHRFVIASAIRAEMKARGWIEEGVAFCLPPQS